MFNIKWNNGIVNYKTTYFGGFKRFHSCNAGMVEIEHTSNDNALHHDIKTIKYALVSYDTPIAYVLYYHDLTTNKDGFNVHINRNAYNCSSATIHQLSRFLRETMGNIFDYYDVKHYDKKYPLHKDIAIASYCPIHIFWCDSSDLRYIIESNTNSAWATNVMR